jgi:hypothetical protein
MNQNRSTSSPGAQPDQLGTSRPADAPRLRPAVRPTTRPPLQADELNLSGAQPELAPFAPIVIKPKPLNSAAKPPTVSLSSSDPARPEAKAKIGAASASGASSTTGSAPASATVRPTTAEKSSSVYFSRGDSDRSATTHTSTQSSTAAPVYPTPTHPKSMPVQTPAISEFRKNVERQTREQKAVGDVMSWVGYSLLGGLIIVALMAGFGGYTLYHMIQDQSVTVAQFEAKYESETAALRQNIKDLQQELTQTRSLTSRQQEQITRLSSRADEAAAIIKTQKQIIDRDMTELKGRVRRIEGVRP